MFFTLKQAFLQPLRFSFQLNSSSMLWEFIWNVPLRSQWEHILQTRWWRWILASVSLVLVWSRFIGCMWTDGEVKRCGQIMRRITEVMAPLWPKSRFYGLMVVFKHKCNIRQAYRAVMSKDKRGGEENMATYKCWQREHKPAMRDSGATKDARFSIWREHRQQRSVCFA